jgi:hypothetical protein
MHHFGDLAEVGINEVEDAEDAADVDEEGKGLAPEEVGRREVLRSAHQRDAQPALQRRARARGAGEPEELRGVGLGEMGWRVKLARPRAQEKW